MPFHHHRSLMLTLLLAVLVQPDLSMVASAPRTTRHGMSATSVHRVVLPRASLTTVRAHAPLAPTAPPSLAPTPEPSAAPGTETITITTPVADARITSPVQLTGMTNFQPFESNLIGRVRDANGTVLGMGPITVQERATGQGGLFAGTLTFTAPWWPQDGTLELVAASPKDGTVQALARIPVRLAEGPLPPFVPVRD